MKQILFVEDDVVVIRNYRSPLQLEGYEVEVAMDGEAAVAFLERNVPSAVILDLQVPRLSGVEVLKHIRKIPALAAVPVIVLTGGTQVKLLEEAAKIGANKIVAKTDCSPAQLLGFIKELAQAAAEPPKPAASKTATTSGDGSKVVQCQFKSAPSASIEPATEAGSYEAMRCGFLDHAPRSLAKVRASMLALNRAEDDGTRVPLLAEMAEQVQSVAARAGIAGFGRAAQLGNSLGSLMVELRDKPKNIHVSSLRTMVTALDLLDVMVKGASSQTEEVSLSAQALVVDDEAICRRTLCTALSRAGLKHVSLDRPELALAVAEQNRFDLVFLDVNMPGMNGFELATKLRALPTNAGTPIIFVTTLSDFKSRAQSTLSGGNDFIVKPFPLIELAVKALTYLLKPAQAPKISSALAA